MKLYIKKIYIILFSALIVLSITGCGQQQEASQPDEHAVPVEVSEAMRGTIVNINRISGEIVPIDRVAIIPKVSGIAREVRVDIGDEVKKDQILMQLETTELENAVRQAEAGYISAKSNYESSKSNYKNTKTNYERTKRLFDEGAVSQREYDEIKTAYSSTKDGVEAAKAQVDQAQAGHESALERLNDATIKAPMDGIISMREARVGEMVAQGNPVFTIVNIDEITIEINVSENTINNVKKGQEIVFQVDSVGDDDFDGIVTNVSPAADPRTKTFPVRIKAENPEHILKGGMFARVLLPTEIREDTVYFNRDAIVDTGTERIVYVVENDTAVKRNIETGISDGTRIEAISGVTEGDKVIVRGQNTVRDGSKVVIGDWGDGR